MYGPHLFVAHTHCLYWIVCFLIGTLFNGFFARQASKPSTSWSTVRIIESTNVVQVQYYSMNQRTIPCNEIKREQKASRFWHVSHNLYINPVPSMKNGTLGPPNWLLRKQTKVLFPLRCRFRCRFLCLLMKIPSEDGVWSSSFQQSMSRSWIFPDLAIPRQILSKTVQSPPISMKISLSASGFLNFRGSSSNLLRALPDLWNWSGIPFFLEVF